MGRRRHRPRGHGPVDGRGARSPWPCRGGYRPVGKRSSRHVVHRRVTGATIRVAYDDERYIPDSLEQRSRVGALSRRRRASRSWSRPGRSVGPDVKLAALAAAMRVTDVPFDELDAAGVRERFPEIAMRSAERALFHAEAGTVLADAAMRALMADAVGAGVEVSMPERCIAIEVGMDEATGRDRPADGACRPCRGRCWSMVGRAAAIGGHRRAAGPGGCPGDVPRGPGARRSSRHRRLADGWRRRRVRASGPRRRLQGGVRRGLDRTVAPGCRGVGSRPGRAGSIDRHGSGSACRGSSLGSRSPSGIRGR